MNLLMLAAKSVGPVHYQGFDVSINTYHRGVVIDIENSSGVFDLKEENGFAHMRWYPSLDAPSTNQVIDAYELTEEKLAEIITKWADETLGYLTL